MGRYYISNKTSCKLGDISTNAYPITTIEDRSETKHIKDGTNNSELCVQLFYNTIPNLKQKDVKTFCLRKCHMITNDKYANFDSDKKPSPALNYIHEFDKSEEKDSIVSSHRVIKGHHRKCDDKPHNYFNIRLSDCSLELNELMKATIHDLKHERPENKCDNDSDSSYNFNKFRTNLENIQSVQRKKDNFNIGHYPTSYESFKSFCQISKPSDYEEDGSDDGLSLIQQSQIEFENLLSSISGDLLGVDKRTMQMKNKMLISSDFENKISTKQKPNNTKSVKPTKVHDTESYHGRRKNTPWGIQLTQQKKRQKVGRNLLDVGGESKYDSMHFDSEEKENCSFIDEIKSLLTSQTINLRKPIKNQHEEEGKEKLQHFSEHITKMNHKENDKIKISKENTFPERNSCFIPVQCTNETFKNDLKSKRKLKQRRHNHYDHTFLYWPDDSQYLISDNEYTQDSKEITSEQEMSVLIDTFKNTPKYIHKAIAVPRGKPERKQLCRNDRSDPDIIKHKKQFDKCINTINLVTNKVRPKYCSQKHSSISYSYNYPVSQNDTIIDELLPLYEESNVLGSENVRQDYTDTTCTSPSPSLNDIDYTKLKSRNHRDKVRQDFSDFSNCTFVDSPPIVQLDNEHISYMKIIPTGSGRNQFKLKDIKLTSAKSISPVKDTRDEYKEVTKMISNLLNNKPCLPCVGIKTSRSLDGTGGISSDSDSKSTSEHQQNSVKTRHGSHVYRIKKGKSQVLNKTIYKKPLVNMYGDSLERKVEAMDSDINICSFNTPYCYKTVHEKKSNSSVENKCRQWLHLSSKTKQGNDSLPIDSQTFTTITNQNSDMNSNLISRNVGKSQEKAILVGNTLKDNYEDDSHDITSSNVSESDEEVCMHTKVMNPQPSGTRVVHTETKHGEGSSRRDVGEVPSNVTGADDTKVMTHRHSGFKFVQRYAENKEISSRSGNKISNISLKKFNKTTPASRNVRTEKDISKSEGKQQISDKLDEFIERSSGIGSVDSLPNVVPVCEIGCETEQYALKRSSNIIHLGNVASKSKPFEDFVSGSELDEVDKEVFPHRIKRNSQRGLKHIKTKQDNTMDQIKKSKNGKSDFLKISEGTCNAPSDNITQKYTLDNNDLFPLLPDNIGSSLLKINEEVMKKEKPSKIPISVKYCYRTYRPTLDKKERGQYRLLIKQKKLLTGQKRTSKIPVSIQKKKNPQTSTTCQYEGMKNVDNSLYAGESQNRKPGLKYFRRDYHGENKYRTTKVKNKSFDKIGTNYRFRSGGILMKNASQLLRDGKPAAWKSQLIRTVSS